MAYEDLRHGYLAVTPHYYQVDMPFYRQNLADFLPDKIIDIHTHAGRMHVWQPGDKQPDEWPLWINKGCSMSVANLLAALNLLFPGKNVAPVVLSPVVMRPGLIDAHIDFMTEQLRAYPHVGGFLPTNPDWTEEQLVKHFQAGGFSGLKPYMTMAAGVSPQEITIFDYLPERHLKVAQEMGWVIMLHIPRPGRLSDETNIRHLKQIADHFPDLKIILAHIGRAYCPGMAEEGLQKLGDTALYYYWDFAANVLQSAMEALLSSVGSERVLYGSDLPILAVHARRVCEGSNYVNLMLEADWSDSHTRVVSPQERQGVTFLLYEELLAFRRAAESLRLSRTAVEKIFYDNALRLLNNPEWQPHPPDVGGTGDGTGNIQGDGHV